MPPQSLDVRYREQSGKHLLAASISPFDPLSDIEAVGTPPSRPEALLYPWFDSQGF